MANTFYRIYRFTNRTVTHALHSNKYWNWYVFTKALSKEWEDGLMNLYKDNCQNKTKGISPNKASDDVQDKATATKTVICVFNGQIESGGLADRLKGIVTTFQICKELNLPFKILFNSPFDLSDYMVPNAIDWQIDANDVVFDLQQATPVILQIGQESEYQAKKQYRFLKEKIMNAGSKQVHVYTNSMYSYTADYGRLFNKLFKPSERVQNAINKQLIELGNDYISVSVRFIGNLGDFEDTQKAPALPKELQGKLISACLSHIETLHSKHPDMRILVNSDSKTFLSEADKYDYTYVIPGEIHHLDIRSEQNDYHLYEKTFIDYFMIANAKKVYRIDEKWTHTSGFPFSAAKVYNRQFESIKGVL